MPPWWPGACVSYARSAGRGRPVLPLLEYPHFPWSLTALEASELSAEAVDAIANGGGIWYAMYAPDDADPAGWDALGATLAELDGVPQGGDQITYVGVLASRRSAERYGASESESRMLDDIVGTVGAVRSLQLPYAMIAAEALTAEVLAACAVVIVPSAACLSEREVDLLTAYVVGGGSVIVFGSAGTHDGDGRPRRGRCWTSSAARRRTSRSTQARRTQRSGTPPSAGPRGTRSRSSEPFLRASRETRACLRRSRWPETCSRCPRATPTCPLSRPCAAVRVSPSTPGRRGDGSGSAQASHRCASSSSA